MDACPLCGVDRDAGELHSMWCRIGKEERELQTYLKGVKTMSKDDGVMRSFDTGATRDTSEGKLEYDGFLCPKVLRQYAKYMNMNRLQSDGQLRDSDNWQKGIPMKQYIRSGWRHWWEMWSMARELMSVKDGIGFTRCFHIALMAGACGLLFNVMGFIHEYLKVHPEVDFDDSEPTEEMKERQAKVANKAYAEKVTPDEEIPYKPSGFQTRDRFKTTADQIEIMKIQRNLNM